MELLRLPCACLVRLPRLTKRAILVGYDVVALGLCAWFAFALWLNRPAPPIWDLAPVALPAAAALVAVFLAGNVYRSVTRFLGLRAILIIFLGVALSGGVFALLTDLAGVGAVPLPVSVSYWMAALLTVGGGRVVAQRLLQNLAHRYVDREAVILYGAGTAGRQSAVALNMGREYRPVAFVDDNPALHGMFIHSLPVCPPDELGRLVARHGVTQVVLAIPSIRHAERRAIVERLAALTVQVRTLPGLADLVSGRARVDELQNLEIEDLLGREKIVPDRRLLERNIAGKVVLVTGAGGSIGGELCRQIVALRPARLLLYESGELALFTVEKELAAIAAAAGIDLEIVRFLGDVRDRARLSQIMGDFGVQTVYHAAAYKHVPLVEYNVIEGIRNNLFGTWACAEAAVAAGVEAFVLISTDKAVRPTNVMGASKRLAEVVLQGIAERGVATRLTMVRFGNVLGSSGSVVPVFRDQIRAGGPVTVTHPEIVRYFMTLSEAAELVIQAGAMASGGEVFVLDMGKPVRIVDVARRMIQLMGLQVRDERHPDGDIAIAFTGLRPGEKLYEELLIGDNVSGTSHPRIMRAEEQAFAWPQVETMLARMQRACDTGSYQAIRDLLRETVAGYAPAAEPVDPLWLAAPGFEGRGELLLAQASGKLH